MTLRHLLSICAVCLSLAFPVWASPAWAGDALPSTDSSHKILMLLRASPQHYNPGASYGDGYGSSAERSANRRLAMARADAHGLTLVDDWPIPILGLDCYELVVPNGQSVEDAAAQLSRDPGVEWAEPLHIYKTQSAPPRVGRPVSYNDPLFPTQPTSSTWHLRDLHALATGQHVRVAVIDSMVQIDHPDLAGQVILSRNFVANQPTTPELHGTGVAGIIAASGNNGLGIVGVAPKARVMALRACWQQSAAADASPAAVCDSLTLAEALDFAITNGAQIINLSLSGPRDPLLAKLLDIAIARGITVVGAVDHTLADGGFPASHTGVIAVDDVPTAMPKSDVFSAPGIDMPTTQPGSRWYLVSGSSFAAADVSGLFALMRERNPHARTAAFLVTTGTGGAIDACATLMKAAAPCNCACPPTPAASH